MSSFFMLGKEAIEQFKRIYREEFGIELDDKQASVLANNLLNLYKAIYNNDDFGRKNELGPGDSRQKSP